VRRNGFGEGTGGGSGLPKRVTVSSSGEIGVVPADRDGSGAWSGAAGSGTGLLQLSFSSFFSSLDGLASLGVFL
jgi:hypothetical protein